MLLAENNIPLAFADKLNAILPSIFPDSKIAKEYKMGKTKASCIINESLAPHFLQQTVDIMKTDFYSLSTDGLNNTGLNISPAEMQNFYSATHTFYSEIFSYAIQKLPINDSVLKHCFC